MPSEEQLVPFLTTLVLADVWDEEPHIVLRQPNPEIPVFDVHQEVGKGRVKTLHRNELLPFNHVLER